MKYLKEIRQCPNGWEDCSLCANDQACDDGTYRPEPELIESDLDVVIRAAEICEKVAQAEVVESVEKCRGSWFDEYSQMDADERWTDFYKYHPPNLVSKDPVPAGEGSPGGGGSNGVKQEKKGTKKTIYEWGCFK